MDKKLFYIFLKFVFTFYLIILFCLDFVIVIVYCIELCKRVREWISKVNTQNINRIEMDLKNTVLLFFLSSRQNTMLGMFWFLQGENFISVFFNQLLAKRIEYILERNLLEKSVKRPFCCTVSILQVYFTYLCYITFWALEYHFIENLKLILKENQIMK